MEEECIGEGVISRELSLVNNYIYFVIAFGTEIMRKCLSFIFM